MSNSKIFVENKEFRAATILHALCGYCRFHVSALTNHGHDHILRTSMANIQPQPAMLKVFGAVLITQFLVTSLSAEVKPPEKTETLLQRKIDLSAYAVHVGVNGCHIAWVTPMGGQYEVHVDGKRLNSYPHVETSAMCFSPNGEYLAYAASRDTQWFMVADGKEQPAYDSVSSPVFGRTGSLAYIAKEKTGWIVLNGSKSSQTFSQIVADSLLFDPTGRTLVFVAQVGGLWHVVKNNDVGPGFDKILEGSLLFSQDGKRWAYVGIKGRRMAAVIDGKAGPLFDLIGNPLAFSGDGSRVGYYARDGQKQFLVLDGIKGKEYDDLIGPYFSKKGDKVAYWSLEANLWHLHVNEKEVAASDRFSPVSYSGGGHHIYYSVMKDNKSRLFSDQTPGPEFDAVGQVFVSQVPNAVSYIAQIANGFSVVTDGKRGPAFDFVNNFLYSADGMHYAYVGFLGGNWTVILDGEKVAHEIGAVFGPSFTSNDTLEYLVVRRGQSLWRVMVNARTK